MKKKVRLLSLNSFLPIIPMVIINGSSGIAVGFASNILNRNPKDVVKYCQNILNGKKNKGRLSPYCPYFNGEYRVDLENHKKWYNRGILNVINTTTVKVTELPQYMSYEKFEDILDKLDDSKVIASYDNNSSNGSINYDIKFSRENLSKYSEEQLYKLLKLEESLTENFNVLNEDGNLISFESAEDICEYFVDFRLKYYDRRKVNTILKLKKDETILTNRAKFIKAVIDGVIVINNKKER